MSKTNYISGALNKITQITKTKMIKKIQAGAPWAIGAIFAVYLFAPSVPTMVINKAKAIIPDKTTRVEAAVNQAGESGTNLTLEEKINQMAKEVTQAMNEEADAELEEKKAIKKHDDAVARRESAQRSLKDLESQQTGNNFNIFK